LWRGECRVNVALRDDEPLDGNDGIERVAHDSDGAVVAG
jgi:hypothetical protein